MIYRVKAIYAAGKESTYTAIGNRDALMDAEYDSGALSVTIIKE